MLRSHSYMKYAFDTCSYQQLSTLVVTSLDQDYIIYTIV